MNEPRAVVSLRCWTDFASVDAVLGRCLGDLGGLDRTVRPGQVVLIKPNITANAPASSGGTTHVELVEALVRRVQALGPARVIVAEGTGAFGVRQETAFPADGWREMAARTGAELYNLDAGPHVDISPPRPRYPHPLRYAQPVLSADIYISVPVLKTHNGADYTVALKNGFAVLPQAQRSEIHGQGLLEQALVDLNRVHAPDLVVVDGWDGAEGLAGGTHFERPAGARLMLASRDPVAVDVVAKEVMGLPAPTRYLTWAAEDGLGEGDLARIALRGGPLDACRHPFLSPAEEYLEGMPGLSIRDLAACSGCRVNTLMSLHRFYGQRLLQPVTLVYGGADVVWNDSPCYRGAAWQGPPPPLDGVTLSIGDCAARVGCSAHVPGCPPTTAQVMDALDALGCVCVRCREVAREALAGAPEELLRHLRVSAAGAQVHVGERVQRASWHLELLVGDCVAGPQSSYGRAVTGRARSFGMDPERDIVLLEGCPPSAKAVRGALGRLAAALAAHHSD